MFFRPGLEMRQELFHKLFVADEIVVDQIDVTAIPEVMERLQFAQHLLGRLRARHAAEEFNDIAEFAVKRTAAAPLHAHMQVAVELEKIEARMRAPA